MRCWISAEWPGPWTAAADPACRRSSPARWSTRATRRVGLGQGRHVLGAARARRSAADLARTLLSNEAGTKVEAAARYSQSGHFGAPSPQRGRDRSGMFVEDLASRTMRLRVGHATLGVGFQSRQAFLKSRTDYPIHGREDAHDP
jgi:hypothetical protein